MIGESEIQKIYQRLNSYEHVVMPFKVNNEVKEIIAGIHKKQLQSQGGPKNVGGRLFTTVSQKMRQAPVTTSYENDAETFFVTNMINNQGKGLNKIQSSPAKPHFYRLQSDLINDEPDALNEVELNDLSDKLLH